MTVLLFVIAAAVAVYVLQPLFRADPADADADTSVRQVSDVTGDALRDLELDWSTGKLSDGDYQRQRVQLMTEAGAREHPEARPGSARSPNP